MGPGNNVQSRPGWWRLGADGSQCLQVRTADSLAVVQVQGAWAFSDVPEEVERVEAETCISMSNVDHGWFY